MKKRYLFMVMAGFLLVQGCAAFSRAWISAEDKSSGSRFIPVELWSGESWDGNQDTMARPANTIFGKRAHKYIKGPFEWRHPVTGKILQVYERINKTTKGLKRQLFTVNPDGTGLAKVFDERPGQPTRLFSQNAVLFPLGRWKKGEKRTFEFTEYVDGKKFKRTALVYVRRLSFKYKGTKHAMKYDWISTDGNNVVLFHERFIYGPGKSLMYFKDRLKQKG